MTPSKLFLLLLSAYLLIHVRCGVVADDDDTVKSIIDIAKAALHALEIVVDTGTRVTLLTLDGLRTATEALKEFILKITKFEVDKIGDDIFAKLDDLKKDAAAIALDIIDCTEDRENDLKQLLVVFVNKTGDCAVERIDEVLDSVAALVLDIQNISEEIQSVTAELEECQTDANATACVIKVMKEIENAAAVIPGKVSEDEQLAKKRVDELVNYLFECERDNVNELEMRSQEIFNGIVECVEEKISNPDVVFVP